MPRVFYDIRYMLLKQTGLALKYRTTTNLLNDARHDKYDCAVVLSNDSDLVEGIKLAKSRRKTVGVITTKNATTPLMQVASFHRRLDKNYLKNRLMPDTIPGTM